jgi:serine protease Do
LPLPIPERPRAWLGIHLQEVTPELARALEIPPRGALVSEVEPGSPAEAAGIQPGDVIVGLDEEEVEDVADLVRLVRWHEPGDRVTVHILRDGEARTIRAVLGERPAPAAPPPAPPLQGTRLGVEAMTPDADLASYFGITPGDGVLVLRVLPGSPAEEAGVRSGDVILELEGEAVPTVSALRRLLRRYAGEEVRLLVLRHHHRKELRADLSRPWSPPGPEEGWESRPGREGPGREMRELRRRLKAWARGLERTLEELRDRLRELERELRERD